MPDPHRELDAGKLAALKLLQKAYDDAVDTGQEPSQFAVGKDELMACGASSSDLLWLLHLRKVEHVREVTRNGAGRRQFLCVTRGVFASHRVYRNGGLRQRTFETCYHCEYRAKGNQPLRIRERAD